MTPNRTITLNGQPVTNLTPAEQEAVNQIQDGATARGSKWCITLPTPDNTRTQRLVALLESQGFAAHEVSIASDITPALARELYTTLRGDDTFDRNALALLVCQTHGLKPEEFIFGETKKQRAEQRSEAHDDGPNARYRIAHNVMTNTYRIEWFDVVGQKWQESSRCHSLFRTLQEAADALKMIEQEMQIDRAWKPVVLSA